MIKHRQHKKYHPKRNLKSKRKRNIKNIKLTNKKVGFKFDKLNFEKLNFKANLDNTERITVKEKVYRSIHWIAETKMYKKFKQTYFEFLKTSLFDMLLLFTGVVLLKPTFVIPPILVLQICLISKMKFNSLKLIYSFTLFMLTMTNFVLNGFDYLTYFIFSVLISYIVLTIYSNIFDDVVFKKEELS